MANLQARWLRNNMTPQEVKLWVQLRYFNARGFHFRRQAPVGDYIVDFVEKTAKLVIEVDGSQYSEAEGRQQDVRRDTKLKQLGFTVLRFWNIDIDQAMDGVIDKITEMLSTRPPPVTLRVTPSPLREEG